MKRNSAFKQFAKDCPQHFSKDVLSNPNLLENNAIQYVKKEKSTRNSKLKNKFWSLTYNNYITKKKYN